MNVLVLLCSSGSKDPPVLEFDPKQVCYQPPFPYFFKEPYGRFFRKFRELDITSSEESGNCLFLCFSHGYYNKKKYWRKLKSNLAQYVENRIRKQDSEGLGWLLGPSLTWRTEVQEVLSVLKTDGAWGNLSHIMLFEIRYNCAVYVWRENVEDLSLFECIKTPRNKYPEGSLPTVIHLRNHGDVHYTFLEPNRNYTGHVERSPSWCKGLPNVQVLLSPPASAFEVLGSPMKELPQTFTELHHEPQDLSLKFEDDHDEALGSYTDDLPSQNFDSQKSFTSSGRSSKSGRPSHQNFMQKLTHVDLMENVAYQLGKSGYCCTQNCLFIYRDVDGTPVLKSSSLPDPLHCIAYCRRLSTKQGEKERGRFIFEQYKQGFCDVEQFTDEILCMELHQDSQDFERNSVVLGKRKRVDFRMFLPIEDRRYPVCRKAFDVCFGVSERMSRRFRSSIKKTGSSADTGKERSGKMKKVATENPETRELSDVALTAVTYIRVYSEQWGEKMPHKEETRISFTRNFVYDRYRTQYQRSKDLEDAVSNKEIVSLTYFYKLWNDYCANIGRARWKGDHCICNDCMKFAQADSNPSLSNAEKLEKKAEFAKHLATVQASRLAYAQRREFARLNPNQFMSIICDATRTSRYYLISTQSPRLKTQRVSNTSSTKLWEFESTPLASGTTSMSHHPSKEMK